MKKPTVDQHRWHLAIALSLIITYRCTRIHTQTHTSNSHFVGYSIFLSSHILVRIALSVHVSVLPHTPPPRHYPHTHLKMRVSPSAPVAAAFDAIPRLCFPAHFVFLKICCFTARLDDLLATDDTTATLFLIHIHTALSRSRSRYPTQH